ncbi:hypothetical protein LOAG_09376 [Loa loa]|uniref:Uncharacterized protein n=1 Tax=Loa loa TaxID=7209 RepID=A0A1S0TTL4_LOALO|nr:hypothetical protein LOAG_09376 [Loa loa]EFO19119.1 hypothetical protein LOAG_09376 [Loa loa]
MESRLTPYAEEKIPRVPFDAARAGISLLIPCKFYLSTAVNDKMQTLENKQKNKDKEALKIFQIIQTPENGYFPNNLRRKKNYVHYEYETPGEYHIQAIHK